MSTNATPSFNDPAQLSTASIDDTSRAGLALLWQAYTYAQDAGAELWDFALEVDKLYKTGLTISDLRWLVAKGFVEHGQETSVYGDSHRSFRPSGGFNFENATCLVLTPRGAALASRVLRESAGCRPPTWPTGLASLARIEPAAAQSGLQPANNTDGRQAAPKPCWDPTRRELRLADVIVKRFRVPARNQELILVAFEEEDWPEHIDDPLPVSADIDPHTRLHDAINRLNGHQTNRLLRFNGNGSGTGVSWGLRNSERPQTAREGEKTDSKPR